MFYYLPINRKLYIISESFILKELNKTNVRFQIIYWSIVAVLIILAGLLFGWKYVWLIGVAAGIISKPIGKRLQNRRYARLVKDEQ